MFFFGCISRPFDNNSTKPQHYPQKINFIRPIGCPTNWLTINKI